MENLKLDEPQVTTDTTHKPTLIPTSHFLPNKNNRLLFSRVGETFETKQGGTLTVIGISDVRANKSYKHLVHCSRCSLDKELFPDPFIIKYQKLVKGQAPCLCSKTYKYSEWQLEVLCKRRCEELGIKFKHIIFGKPLIKGSKPVTECVHGEVIHHSLDTFLNNKSTSCTLCEADKISEAREFSSWRSIPEVVESIDYVFVNGIRKYFYRCKICSYDRYVQEGYCSGTFNCELTRLGLYGKFSCRCGEKFYGDNNYKLGRVRFLYENTPQFSFEKVENGLVYGSCSLHGDFVKDYSNTLENSLGCCKPSGWGIIKGRELDEDYLYIMLMEDDVESFIKIGRSFDIRVRQDDLDKHYTTNLLFFLKSEHRIIHKYEKFYHKIFKRYKYKSGISFGGDSELFYKDILEDKDFKLLISDELLEMIHPTGNAHAFIKRAEMSQSVLIEGVSAKTGKEYSFEKGVDYDTTNFAKAYEKWKQKKDKETSSNSSSKASGKASSGEGKQTLKQESKPAENGSESEKVNASKPQPVSEPEPMDFEDDLPFMRFGEIHGKKMLHCM